MTSTTPAGASAGRRLGTEKRSWSLSNRGGGRILSRHPAPHPTIRFTRRREEDSTIRPTPRSTIDSPITLRRIAVVLIAGICGLVAFAVYGQVAQSRHLDAQVTALATENTSMVQQISDREREIADAQTVAWLEEEARQLGYVFPGEKLYVIVPPGSAKTSTGVGVSVPIPTFKVQPPTTPTPSPTPKPITSPSPSPTPSHGPTPTPSPTPTAH
jgi:cell division protein FtsB